VFLNFLGVPIVDLRFEGPYPVYHSAYDTHEWVSRIDPDFRQHAQLTRIWSTVATRLANADAIPLDAVRYAHRIREFLSDTERRWIAPLPVAGAALARFDAAAANHSAATADALAAGDKASLEMLNRGLIAMERAFVDPAGLDGRPWYRHQIYAPTFAYQPELLPALSEAINAGNQKRVADAERRLAAALERAADCLEVFTTFPAAPAS